MDMQLNTNNAQVARFPKGLPPRRSQPVPKHETLALLRLGNLLHTNLSSPWVIEQFYRESHKPVGYTGLIYQYPGENTGFSHGVLGGHNCSYDLVLNGDYLGSLDLYKAQGFSDNDLVQVEHYLHVLLHPLRNALLFQKAQDRAFRDHLTGARNRAAFDSDLIVEIELAHRHNHPLSVIVMDIDHFKKINDSQGHNFGDEVLKYISQAAQEVIRGGDQLYRYGGEEFVVIAPHSALDGTRLLAERLRLRIYEQNYGGIQGLTLSSSFGVAQLRDNESASELFVRADQALYAAKHNGRNQVVA
ncbi:MAG: GGDEF domain-containing protein [Gammaproteobacteria bacterium SHHR-1]|uniref:GGDEF domain-containing protein n=1 Tax=Magnetovirga frankeli TaxID=947516 RepID=UPI00129335D4|nr:GGDEF domain-containing protein [gamma proteobacterium SS-5]